MWYHSIKPEGEGCVHSSDVPIIQQLANPHPLVALCQCDHPALAAPEPADLLELSLQPRPQPRPQPRTSHPLPEVSPAPARPPALHWDRLRPQPGVLPLLLPLSPVGLGAGLDDVEPGLSAPGYELLVDTEHLGEVLLLHEGGPHHHTVHQLPVLLGIRAQLELVQAVAEVADNPLLRTGTFQWDNTRVARPLGGLAGAGALAGCWPRDQNSRVEQEVLILSRAGGLGAEYNMTRTILVLVVHH